jgi:acetyl esterase
MKEKVDSTDNQLSLVSDKKVLAYDQETPKKTLIFDHSVTAHRVKVASAAPTLEALENIPFLDMLVPVEKNVQIPVRIYTPPHLKNNEKLPTLFYIPGTGFVAAEIKFTHVTCTHVCQNAKCRVIVIHHRLAPENQFPAPYLDAYKVINFFVKESPNIFSIDINKIAISGYSSGGNIAAAIAIKALKEGIPIKKQILISPMVDFSRTLPGFKIYEEKDTDITEEFLHWIIGLYLPPSENPRNPKASPFWMKEKKIKGLPSTDIILAQYDRCRSDSEYYYLKLKKADVPVEKFVLDNETHAFLWRNIKVTEKFAERLQIAFKDIALEKPLTNTISHISLKNKAEEKEENTNKLKLIKANL